MRQRKAEKAEKIDRTEKKEKPSRGRVAEVQVPDEELESGEDEMGGALVRRMNRIQGQILGIGKMIEDQRTCVDILNQISAVKSALDGVAMAILERQAYQCFQETVENQENKRSMHEFIDIVRRYSR